MIEWPPSVSIKTHPRARRVKLKASLQHGLELIVPPRFKANEVPSILEENRKWIEKQLKLLAQKKLTSVDLPIQINLLALNEQWKIVYILTEGSFIRIIPRPHFELVLAGDVNNKLLCKRALCSWLKSRAKMGLTPKLQTLSQTLQLSYKNVRFRFQQTRWGSCSADKTINLNCTLLFLPDFLVRHVMIHELCHLKYLNHSQQFWKMVQKFDENCDLNRHLLKKSDHFLPGWLLL